MGNISSLCSIVISTAYPIRGSRRDSCIRFANKVFLLNSGLFHTFAIIPLGYFLSWPKRIVLPSLFITAMSLAGMLISLTYIKYDKDYITVYLVGDTGSVSNGSRCRVYPPAKYDRNYIEDNIIFFMGTALMASARLKIFGHALLALCIGINCAVEFKVTQYELETC